MQAVVAHEKSPLAHIRLLSRRLLNDQVTCQLSFSVEAGTGNQSLGSHLEAFVYNCCHADVCEAPTCASCSVLLAEIVARAVAKYGGLDVSAA
jgi:hypothetical protein